MYPVGAVIIDKINHRTDRPCKRIGPIDVLNFVYDVHEDYIANASENGYGKESIVHFLDTIMKTASGKYLAASVLGVSDAARP